MSKKLKKRAQQNQQSQFKTNMENTEPSMSEEKLNDAYGHGETRSQIEIELYSSEILTKEIKDLLGLLSEKLKPVILELRKIDDSLVDVVEVQELVPTAKRIHTHNHKLELLKEDLKLIIESIQV